MSVRLTNVTLKDLIWLYFSKSCIMIWCRNTAFQIHIGNAVSNCLFRAGKGLFSENNVMFVKLVMFVSLKKYLTDKLWSFTVGWNANRKHRTFYFHCVRLSPGYSSFRHSLIVLMNVVVVKSMKPVGRLSDWQTFLFPVIIQILMIISYF